MTASAPATDAVTMRDTAASRRFLHLLDPNAESFTFQTFDDDRRPGHATNGLLAQSTSDRKQIIELYEAGAGVFVTINETDLRGRKSENIIRIRAVWQEDDSGHGGPFPLEPSMVVESSPDHFHRYWLLADAWPADDQGRKDFAVVMERMVTSYGCDHRAKDISRVLRLPGFLHRKDPDRPHMVRIVEASERRYTREEIKQAFPPVERETQRQTNYSAGNEQEERIRDALRHIPADDRDIWLQIGMALKDELGDGGRGLWDNWSATCAEKYKDRDQDRTWRSFKRNGIGIGTLFWHAKRNGWEPPRHERASEGGPSVASVASVASAAWPVMDAAAYHGIAGEAVDTIDPHTESDKVAVLLQLLAMVGNAIGRVPYYKVENSHHYPNLYVLLVGDSAKARKGTGYNRARSVVEKADPTWANERIKGGLSSGEGFINEVRDERQEWDKKEGRMVVADPGAPDKRLMIVETEFVGPLTVMDRAGNTLSPLVRRAWDGDKLATLTVGNPLRATGAHISIVAHITIDELRAKLTRTDAASGFANRFLFALVKRSKELPFGGGEVDTEIQNLGDKVRAAVERAKTIGRVGFSKEAAELWRKTYPALTAAQPGLLGSLVARGDAQTVRLALVYALLDERPDGSPITIDTPHLEAATAVWEYCEASAALIFGDLLGDPIADEIRRALQAAGPAGLTRTHIRDMFNRHHSGRIAAALALLVSKGMARTELQGGQAGRPSEMWFEAGGR